MQLKFSSQMLFMTIRNAASKMTTGPIRFASVAVHGPRSQNSLSANVLQKVASVTSWRAASRLSLIADPHPTAQKIICSRMAAPNNFPPQATHVAQAFDFVFQLQTARASLDRMQMPISSDDQVTCQHSGMVTTAIAHSQAAAHLSIHVLASDAGAAAPLSCDFKAWSVKQVRSHTGTAW